MIDYHFGSLQMFFASIILFMLFTWFISEMVYFLFVGKLPRLDKCKLCRKRFKCDDNCLMGD